MTIQEQTEIGFWVSLAKLHGSNYVQFRASEYHDKTKNFPDFEKETGRGIDYGCGLVSVLHGSNKVAIAFDPLMEYYRKILPVLSAPNLIYTDKLSEADFEKDWILCANVIDHTPDPQVLIDDIYSRLKSGGRLYFEVNFDDSLSPAHYEIWNDEMVEKYLSKFLCIHRFTERNDADNQSRFWGVFIKE